MAPQVVLFFKTLLVLHQVFPNLLPSWTDFALQPPQVLASRYQVACREILKKHEIDGAEIQKALKTVEEILGDTNSSLTEGPPPPSSSVQKNSSEKMDFLKMIRIGNGICFEKSGVEVLASLDRRKIALEYKDLYFSLPFQFRFKLKQAVQILSRDGQAIGYLSEPAQQRVSVPLSQISPFLQQAVIAVEDSRFKDHKGVDEFGIARAMLSNVYSNSISQGGSTITQQIAKNLVVGSDVTIERKVKEALVATRIEEEYSKDKILELYLNLIYFGRNSWGAELASRFYFGKSAQDLHLKEAAFLAGVVHGPDIYRDVRKPSVKKRIDRRISHVLKRMVESKFITSAQADEAKASPLKFVSENQSNPYPYYRQWVKTEWNNKIRNQLSDNDESISVQTHLDTNLQKVAKKSLLDGLMEYERSTGAPQNYTVTNIERTLKKRFQEAKVRFEKEKADFEISQKRLKESNNIGDLLFGEEFPVIPPEAISETTESPSDTTEPIPPTPYAPEIWLDPLLGVENSMARQNWNLGVVLKGKNNNESQYYLGIFEEGTHQVIKITFDSYPLQVGDVVYLEKINYNWLVRAPPSVNGAVVVMEPHTGAVLAEVGGYSFDVNEFNRALTTERQPGSLMKPFTYAVALQQGFAPNDIFSNRPISFPPIEAGAQSWIPSNYSNRYPDHLTLRMGLEHSVNRLTATVMSYTGLDPILDLAKELEIYDQPHRHYPFILGSQETTLARMTRAFCIFPNLSLLPESKVIHQVYARFPDTDTRQSVQVYESSPQFKTIKNLDHISAYQLMSLMQGVVRNGTSVRLREHADYLGGKTGTTNQNRDAWFIGFTQDIVIGVYVGYDKEEYLAGGEDGTGSRVALPIFKRIFNYYLSTLDRNPSLPEPPSGVVLHPIDRQSGRLVEESSGPGIIQEAFRESVQEPRDFTRY